VRWILLTALLLCSCSTPISSMKATSDSESVAAAQSKASQGQGVGTSSMPIFIICNQMISGDSQYSDCLKPGSRASDELHHAIDHGMTH